ncbi:gamma-butyrobetaine dioxygenase [Thalassophryne amazonica]|uniref:gamma-butyrobetaine dioxygenase n=1 Tax=Thalassophryne amazonica TaxID=390379 RepID=UPI001471D587|nr:gamma-butyrobetaine dioxygenase [Thalassophryne amazonica]
MWMSTFARLALPALQRSVPVKARQTLQACCRPGRADGLISVQLRGQQTLGAACVSVSQHALRHARALDEERMVEVKWEDGGQSLYPFTWLRDNCQCPHCNLDSAQARKLLMSQLDVHTGVDSVQVTKDKKLSIVWPDQHASVFEAEWLKKRCFSPAARKALQEELFINDRYYWDSKLDIPKADFHEVLHSDKAALDWILDLRRMGIVYLKNAPAEPGQVARLAERIGYLRLTYYGHTFQVKDKYLANNVAYTTGRLSLHTDYPALHYTPGLQVLHCINQAQEGGESEMVDGFHMAELLKREDPEAFHTLSTLQVDFTDKGMDYCDFMVQSKKTVISVGPDGKIWRISCNNATRDSVLDLPLHQVQPFYRALKAYENLMNRPENLVTYKMEPGDMVTFDNWRLLHGRRSYVGMRHLEGAYLDWDEVMSRFRLLRKSVQGGA